MNNSISVPGKRGQLRLGARGRTDELKPRSRRRLQRQGKHQYGSGTYIPEPQHDWTELRPAKAKCEAGCRLFNPLMGGCRLGLLPGLQCPGPTLRPI